MKLKNDLNIGNYLLISARDFGAKYKDMLQDKRFIDMFQNIYPEPANYF